MDQQDDKSTETETTEAKEPTFSPKAFDAFLDRVSSKASDGGAPQVIRRRFATVTIDHRICELNLFKEPFKVTCEGLSADAEHKALDAGGQQAVTFEMAKRSIRKFNGRSLQEHEVDALWDALAMGGRVVVVNAWQTYCTGVEESLLGKSLKQVEVE